MDPNQVREFVDIDSMGREDRLLYGIRDFKYGIEWGWGWRGIFAEHGWSDRDRAATREALRTIPAYHGDRADYFHASTTYSQHGVDCRRIVKVAPGPGGNGSIETSYGENITEHYLPPGRFDHSQTPHPSHSELLRRYAPKLRFDVTEEYWNASPATMTDHWQNTLVHDDGRGFGGQLLFAHPSQGALGWGLNDLVRIGQPYRGNSHVADPIDSIKPGGDHKAAADSHRYTALDDHVYGHVAHGADGAIWLQYYMFYYYNSDGNTLVGEHEGDWEMVQYRIDSNGSGPIRAATYSQHDFHERRDRGQVEMEWVGDRWAPVVYVAGRGHANYFEPGDHTRAPLGDDARGDGEQHDHPKITTLLETRPNWAHWPGSWGTSRGPARTPGNWWGDPTSFHEAAAPCRKPDRMPC